MGDNSEHALLSASGSPGWLACYGNLAQKARMANTSNPASRKGTAGHTVSANVLLAKLAVEAGKPEDNRTSCLDYVGHIEIVEGDEIEITDEYAGQLQKYVDKVWAVYKSEPGAVLLVETRVNYAAYLGVPQDKAWGTSDAIIYLPLSRRIVVIDLKTGFRWVMAENNGQERLYGLGAYDELALAYEIDEVENMICMSRFMDAEDSEYEEPGVTSEVLSVADLKTWARTEAAMAAQHNLRNYEAAQAHGLATIPLGEYTPGEKQCEYCNPACPGRFQTVVSTIANEFVDLDNPPEGTVAKTISKHAGRVAEADVETLAEMMKRCDMIEDWIKAVRSAVEVHLLAGQAIPGFKLVAGKKGARSWSDPEKAAKKLKTVLGTKDAMTAPEPISPTQAEKHFKQGKLTPRQWQALVDITTQKEGGRHVAREDDPRPAITAGPDRAAFTALEGEADDLSFLA